MQAGSITRVEKNVDQAASVLFGVACGYSTHLWLASGGRPAEPIVAALAAALALITYILAYRTLSAVQPEARQLPVRAFRLHEVEPLEPDDFLEFDSRGKVGLLAAPAAQEPEELLLTDCVEAAEPGSEEASGGEVSGDEASDEEVSGDEALGEQVSGDDESQPSEEIEQIPPVQEQEFDSEQPNDLEEAELTQVAEAQECVEKGESVLDDSLDDFGPDSRVVRLFDAAAMPTPGQLGSRVDRHLHGEVAPMQSAEAAQALQDALAELRRAIPNRLR